MPRHFMIQHKPVFFLALALLTFYTGQFAPPVWAETLEPQVSTQSKTLPAAAENPSGGRYEAFLQKHPVAANFLKNHPQAAEKVKKRLEQREQNCNKALENKETTQ